MHQTNEPPATHTPNAPTADDCIRCGYNLTGIANDQPCPECGLLAERSRRITDEFDQTRPRWLRRLSWGVWLILIGLISPIATGPLCTWIVVRIERSTRPYAGWWPSLEGHIMLIPADVVSLLIARGVWLLASREGYPAADRADRRRRLALRLSLIGPLFPLLVIYANLFLDGKLFDWFGYEWFSLALTAFWTLGSIPLVLLVALRLKDLARRARNPHVAEHSVIVGVGAAATLVYVLVVYVLTNYAEKFGLSDQWANRGTASLIVMVLMPTAGALFVLWQLYLLVRFAITFGRAARRLRRHWLRDDRASLEP